MIPAGCQQRPRAAATAHLSASPSGSADPADQQSGMHAHLCRLSVADDQVLHPLLLIGGQVDVVVLADVVKQDARLLLVLPEGCGRMGASKADGSGGARMAAAVCVLPLLARRHHSWNHSTPAAAQLPKKQHSSVHQHSAPVLAGRQDTRHQLAFKAVGEGPMAQVVAQPRHLWQREGGARAVCSGCWLAGVCTGSCLTTRNGVAQRGTGVPSASSKCTAAEQTARQQHPPPAPQGRSRSAPAPAAWPPGAAQTPARDAQWQAGEQDGSSTDRMGGMTFCSGCLATSRNANSCRASSTRGGRQRHSPPSPRRQQRQQQQLCNCRQATSHSSSRIAPHLGSGQWASPRIGAQQQSSNGRFGARNTSRRAQASPWHGVPRPASAQTACGSRLGTHTLQRRPAGRYAVLRYIVSEAPAAGRKTWHGVSDAERRGSGSRRHAHPRCPAASGSAAAGRWGCPQWTPPPRSAAHSRLQAG